MILFYFIIVIQLFIKIEDFVHFFNYEMKLSFIYTRGSFNNNWFCHIRAHPQPRNYILMQSCLHVPTPERMNFFKKSFTLICSAQKQVLSVTFWASDRKPKSILRKERTNRLFYQGFYKSLNGPPWMKEAVPSQLLVAVL